MILFLEAEVKNFDTEEIGDNDVFHIKFMYLY